MSAQATESQAKTTAQAINGVVPPSVREAKIRTIWPAVSGTSSPLAGLASMCIRSIILAPLGWLLLLPLFLMRLSPFVMTRYTLTNRRVVIQKGWSAKVKEEVALAELDETRLDEDSYSEFYHAADLVLYSGGKPVLTLEGVPEPQSFRQSILNAMMAWVPEKAKALPMKAASEK